MSTAILPAIEPYYDVDGITIYNASCEDVLDSLPTCDLLLTDPPYGISHKSNGQLFVKSEPIHGDDSTAWATYAREYARERDMQCCMFFSPYAPLTGWRSVLVWSKGAHVGIGGDRETCWKRDAELIGVENNKPLRGKRDSCVLQYNAVLPPPSGHFCEKPIELMRYLVNKFDADTILDPFMGSGTTLVAAKLEGRQAIGIEREAKWCEKAVNRLAQGVLC